MAPQQFRARQQFDAMQFNRANRNDLLLWLNAIAQVHIDPADGQIEVLCQTAWRVVTDGSWVVHNPALDVTMVWTGPGFERAYERVMESVPAE